MSVKQIRIQCSVASYILVLYAVATVNTCPLLGSRLGRRSWSSLKEEWAAEEKHALPTMITWKRIVSSSTVCIHCLCV